MFKFAYGHRLSRDCGKCNRLHGHSSKAIIHLKADSLNNEGMVFHFDKIKQTLGSWIADNLDHRMLLEKNDPALEALSNIGEDIVVLNFPPTAENIAKMVFDKALELNLPIFSVEIWESDTAKAKYYGNM